MRKVALRGLFARKLRLVLTALAVALGVTLIAGTYVFTDTINRLVRPDLHPVGEGHRRVDHAAQGDRHVEQRRHAADGVAGRPRAGPPPARRRRAPTARSSTSAPCSARTASASARAAPRTSSPRSPSSRASTPSRSRRAASRRRRTRSRSTPRPRTSSTSSSATRSPSSRRRRARTTRSSASTQIAGVDSFGGATVVDMLLPEAQRMLGKTRLRPDRGRGQAGRRRPSSCATSSGRALPRTVNVRTGQEEARKQSERHQGQPELPDDAAARVRRASRCSSARSSSSTPSRSR